MPNIADYPWVLDDDGYLSAVLDQAYDVIIQEQMITDTNGQEVLNFNLPLDDPKAEQFGNEDVLQAGGSEFTIRTVTDGWDDNGELCFQIYAEARWYELAEYDPIEPFQVTNVSPDTVMNKFLSTTNWTMGTVDVASTGDFSITELTNPLTGIRMLPAIFGGELYFDNINKKVHLLQRIGMDTDLLYAYSKNLKKNQRVIDTRYLVTRFRPIGKDGLNIASVNNGLDYLENYQWFDSIGKKRKVKCDSLNNDQITDATALKMWGQGIVDANSIPRITYYMDVVLDKNDGIPGMGDTVRVYDSMLKMNLPSRVAQRNYNVLQPELSTMQLSTALYTLSDQLNNSVSSMTSRINYLNTETAAVKQDVINAQSSADGKNTVFYGENEPDSSVAKENDLWFQYVNGTLSRMYRFDGVQWQLTTSIIPGDAVIGGTIDFANVTAINIDAGSISTGKLLATLIQIGAGTTFDSGYSPSDIAGSAEANVKTDLNMAAPLPTTLTLNQDGITAATPDDPTKYARLDYRGLFVNKGAIQIQRSDGYNLIMDGVAQFDFGIDAHDPPFQDTTMVHTVGWWYQTSQTSYVDINFYNYDHHARYLRLQIQVGSDAGGQNKLAIFDGDGVTKLYENINGQYYPTGGGLLDITVDLGVPTGNARSFYVRMCTGVSGVATYCRVIRKWLKG